MQLFQKASLQRKPWQDLKFRFPKALHSVIFLKNREPSKNGIDVDKE